MLKYLYSLTHTYIYFFLSEGNNTYFCFFKWHLCLKPVKSSTIYIFTVIPAVYTVYQPWFQLIGTLPSDLDKTALTDVTIEMTPYWSSMSWCELSLFKNWLYWGSISRLRVMWISIKQVVLVSCVQSKKKRMQLTSSVFNRCVSPQLGCAARCDCLSSLLCISSMPPSFFILCPISEKRATCRNKKSLYCNLKQDVCP